MTLKLVLNLHYGYSYKKWVNSFTNSLLNCVKVTYFIKKILNIIEQSNSESIMCEYQHLQFESNMCNYCLALLNLKHSPVQPSVYILISILYVCTMRCYTFYGLSSLSISLARQQVFTTNQFHIFIISLYISLSLHIVGLHFTSNMPEFCIIHAQNKCRI